MIKELCSGSRVLWCGLIEAVCGEIHNALYDIGEHKIADKYLPDIITFTEDDFINCESINDLPNDWRIFAEAVAKANGFSQ